VLLAICRNSVLLMHNAKIMTEIQLPPHSIDKSVMDFCAVLCTDSLPVYVPVKPENYSVKLQCFPNVQTKVKNDGGNLIYGWSISEYSRIFLEAQFHGIWKAPSGNLVDITQGEFSHGNILFLEDRHRTYNGMKVPHQRFSLTDPKKVKKLILLLDSLTDKFCKLVEASAKPGDHAICALRPLFNEVQLLKKELRGKVG